MRQRRHLALTTLGLTLTLACATAWAQGTRILVTNDDNQEHNSATFYRLSNGGLPTEIGFVDTGGIGLDHTAYGENQVVVDQDAGCIYVSNSATNDISSISAANHTLVGTYKPGDGNKAGLGIGLALSSQALYAAFNDTSTIAAFTLGPGCTLEYTGNVSVYPRAPDGIKVHGNILVVAEIDYIESFNVSSVIPVSNGDLQQSTGRKLFGADPAGVDISRDGHWVVFGDADGWQSYIEISDISSGKLSTTVPYKVGTGVNSNNAVFSPDQRFIYVSNNFSLQVSAAFFDNTTGLVSGICSSEPLRGAFETGGLATAPTKDGSGFIYVTEYETGIGVLRAKSNGASCQVVELPGSPVPDNQSKTLRSIATYLQP